MTITEPGQFKARTHANDGHYSIRRLLPLTVLQGAPA